MLKVVSRRSVGGCVRGRHVISTPRLLFRSPTIIDVLAVLAVASDADAQRWLGWEPESVVPERQRERLLNGRARLRRPLLGWGPVRAPLCLVAIDPQNRAYAGMATIQEVTPDACEVGGSLSPDYRGLGLGAELFTAIYQLAHHHFGYAEVRAGTEPTNTACIRSLQSAGFVRVAGSDTHLLPVGRTVPAAWFSRTDPDTAICPAVRHR
ncbi:N-acetyltransferase [Actinomadura sp. KC216]|uniref:GNAT family N-acetyltransferase n=1 Tax=Actinomadura sp. KC216 TaxID=2530370 RepID=UPI0010523A77|nr:GNAT family protein [Actinomadura sp. KC216]TDB78801.1 N-acetyltransferase [Actinomadura sp. KC216]